MRTGRAIWLAAAAGGLALGLSALFYIASNDFFGHLAQGREIFELGRVPDTDGRSVLWDAPRPWANYEWLFDVFLWWMYSFGGNAAVILLKVVTMAATGVALVWLAGAMARQVRTLAAQSQSEDVRASVPSTGGAATAAWIATAVLLAVAPAVRVRMTVRPHVPGFLFVALLLCGLWWLSRVRDKRRWFIVAGLVAMHVLWVNTHGSHLFGLATAGLFAVVAIRTSAFVPMLVLVAGQLLVSGATPFGFSILVDAVEHIVRPEYREIVTDWVAWGPSMPLSWLVLCTAQSLLLLVSLRPVLKSGRFGIAYGLLCIVLTLMAFRSTRFMSYLLLFATPVVAVGLNEISSKLFGRAGVKGFASLALLGSAVWAVYGAATLPPKVPFGVGVSERGFAWSAARYLQQEQRSQRLFSDPMQGWIMMYALPDAKLTIDPRFPFYGVKATNLVRTALAQPEVLRPFLDRYKLDRAVVRHLVEPGPTATAALASWPEWGLVHVENGHALFARKGSETTQPFDWLPAGFHQGRLLESSTSSDAVEAELDRLGTDPNGNAYRHWVRGLSSLRPALRAGGTTGLKSVLSPEERSAAAEAQTLLRVAADEFPELPTVETYFALASIATCDLASAREALARVETPSREATLAGVEASLRSPDVKIREDAAASVSEYIAVPELKDQPWLVALHAEHNAIATCPTMP